MPKTTPSDPLQSFIAHARGKGMDHQTIQMLLMSAGWKERDVARAIGAEGLDMPVPVPSDGGGARDAFFHLLGFAGLYTTVISCLVLLYTYINRWFPDAVLERSSYDPGEYYRTSVRWSLAAAIVAYPIFLWMSRLLLKEMRTHVEKSSSGVRRWLTYLTLFIAASVLMGDVMTVIFRLLEGEITVRFILKVLVVFITTGMVFTYYFQAMRKPLSQHGNLHMMYGITATIMVAATVLYGFVLSGSPANERLRKIDEQRVQDVRTIAEATLDVAYGDRRWERPAPAGYPRALPQTLESLASASIRQRVPLTDPTGTPYGYEVLSRTGFQVCTTFAFVSGDSYAPFWDHPAGDYCYVFDAANNNLP